MKIVFVHYGSKNQLCLEKIIQALNYDEMYTLVSLAFVQFMVFTWMSEPRTL